MNRNLLSAVALAAGPLLWASGAQAAQITFGGSAQNITFTGNGAGALSISSPVLSGSAFYDADPIGTYSISAMSFTTGVHTATGNFTPNANSETFTFTGGDGDTLTQTITWTLIQDDTTRLVGAACYALPTWTATFAVIGMALRFLSGFDAPQHAAVSRQPPAWLMFCKVARAAMLSCDPLSHSLNPKVT